MSERTSSKPGIADYVVARRKRKECFLDEIDRLIDWIPLEKLLRKTLKRVRARFSTSSSPLPANPSPRCPWRRSRICLNQLTIETIPGLQARQALGD